MARLIVGANSQIISPISFFSIQFPMTLSVWLKPTSAVGGGSFFGTATTPGPNGGCEFRLNSDSTVQLLRQSAVPLATSTGTISNGVWTHVAATHNGTNIQLYIAGAPDGTGSDTTQFDNLTQDFGRAGNGDQYDGAFADICVWTTVLTASEIAGLARGIRPSAVRPEIHSGMVAA